jgi:hypothetical protein
LEGVKCVVLHKDLQKAEPMAWAFCLNFAKDNDLLVQDAPTKKPS